MTETNGLSALEQALEDLAARVASLREARSAYPGDLGPTLDASLAELDTASELLGTALAELRRSARRPGGRDGAAQREHKLIRQLFRTLPVPVIVMDGGGVVRRINDETSRLLGSPAGYLVGRPFPLLVDVSRRAAFRSHLSAVLQTGRRAAFQSRLTHQGRAHTVQLVLTRLPLPGEPREMVAVVALPTEVQVSERPVGRIELSDAALLMASARRQELLARMGRLLLDVESLHRPVALARAARLLAAETADWVIVDVIRTGPLVRTAVLGPQDQPVAEVVRQLERLDPAAAPVVRRVMELGSGVVEEMVEDETVLGLLADGTPVLRGIGAASLLCVPIQTGEGVRGAVTLARLAEREPFTLADLGVLEELGVHLGQALRAQRAFQTRVEAADTLRASVVPTSLPDIPGFEAAAIYHPGHRPGRHPGNHPESAVVGAEFYDVFPVRDGWGFAIGGACGEGEAATAVSALVRNGLRVLGAWESDPGEVIRKVNRALLLQGSGMFVMAIAGFTRLRDRRRRVRLASAGHHPAALVRPDGNVRFATGGGVPLGIDEEAVMHTEELEPAAGETLVFYSDGLVASRDRHGERYGQERLTEVLSRCAGQSPAEVVKTIEEDRGVFSEGRFSDEIVVLALRAM